MAAGSPDTTGHADVPKAIRLAFADQLGPHFDDGDRTVFIESRQAFSRAPIHRAKAHVLLSALRHRAHEMGPRATLVRAADYRQGLASLPAEGRPTSVVDPTSHAARRLVRALPGLDVLPSRGFLTTQEDFDRWADKRTRLTLEDWYRRVRTESGVLMEAGKPVGGRWNLDEDNREPPPRGQTTLGLAEVSWPREDDIDAGVRADLDAWERDGHVQFIGDDGPRRFAVTRSEALSALTSFVNERFADFGRYEDAVLAGDPVMAHSLLSVPLNLGLLHPYEVVQAVMHAWESGSVPLNSVEGIVRQIIGWREFVWHCYWRFGPSYPESNHLDAHSPIPSWFTEMHDGDVHARCLATTLQMVRAWGWTHHIPRLMILGNWALQRGYRPSDVNAWFTRAFVDGFEWVMPANVIGMALYADGGRMSTKPYIAGGAYIHRMSDLCRGCSYRPNARTGEQACPFTTGYWSFLERHAELLAGNHRMARSLANLGRIADIAEVLRVDDARGADPP